MNYFVFDFDGTLADTLPLVIDIFNTCAYRHNIKPITSSIDQIRKKSTRQIFKEQKISFFKLPGLVLDVKRELKKAIPGLTINPLLKEVLFTLKKSGIHLDIVSSNTRENIQLFLQQNEIEIFTRIICEPSLYGKKKVLNRYAGKQKIPKKNIYYFGDEIRDIEASKKAQVNACAVTWGYNDRETLVKTGPDYILDTPSDILTIGRDS